MRLLTLWPHLLFSLFLNTLVFSLLRIKQKKAKGISFILLVRCSSVDVIHVVDQLLTWDQSTTCEFDYEGVPGEMTNG